MLFRKLWLSLCAGALLAAHPLQAEEPTQLREVRVAYIGILPSETTEHAVYPGTNTYSSFLIFQTMIS